MRLEGATVVVTGGTGFLGWHVTRELSSAGANAIGLGSRDGDLRVRQEIDRVLQETRPDVVVHLAAVVGGIGANLHEPGRFFYENALMGIELIDACRTHRIPKVVISGTVCSYPHTIPLPFREDSLWDGYPEPTNAPYGLAKKMLLVQAQAYRTQYGMNAVCLLPVNLYGPRDNFDLETSHVIPAMIRKLDTARRQGVDSVALWGDGSPTREFLHVADAARGFRLAIEHYDGEAPVNLGSGQEIRIAELAGQVARAVGYTGEIRWDTGRPNGQPRRRLDTGRARERFGFTADISLERGLEETVRWYRQRHPGRVHAGH